MEKNKDWWYSLIPNLIYFGIFGFLIYWLNLNKYSVSYVVDAWFYILPIYIIGYSIFTYKTLHKILIPCVTFAVVNMVFYVIVDYFTRVISIVQTNWFKNLPLILLIFLLQTLLATAVLLIVQFVTKFIFKLLKK